MTDAIFLHRRGAVRVAAALALAAALLAPGCKRPRQRHTLTIEEDAPRLGVTVRMGDPQAAKQLLSGFHTIEGGSWRWTAKKFVVELRAPTTAAQNGATLEGHFTAPDPVIAQNKEVTLTAVVAGHKCEPLKRSAVGEFTYTCELPAAVFTGESVKAEFSLNKAMPPTASEQRELGLVAASVSLVSK